MIHNLNIIISLLFVNIRYSNIQHTLIKEGTGGAVSVPKATQRPADAIIINSVFGGPGFWQVTSSKNNHDHKN